MSTNTAKKLRSQEWWSGQAYENYARRAWLRSEGFPADVFQNKPVIGICNSWSELNNCNAHLRTVAEAVKRGVLGRGRGAARVPHHLAGRDVHEAHHHALSAT